MTNKYEKNPLSYVPGGVTVELVHKSGKVERHDNVKSPKRYVAKVLTESNTVVKASVVDTGEIIYVS